MGYWNFGRLKTSRVIFIFITAFIDMLGYGMILPLLPMYVNALNGGAVIAGSLSSLYALTQMLSGPILGSLSDHYGRRPVLLICLLGTSIAFLLLGIANSIFIIFLAIFLDGITGGNLTTIYAYIADVTSDEERSRGMSLVGAAFGLGLVGGPAIAGLLSPLGLGAPAFTAAGIAFANVLYGSLILPESLPPGKRMAVQKQHFFNVFRQLLEFMNNDKVKYMLLAVFTLNLAFVGLQTNFPLFSLERFDWGIQQNSYFYAYVGISAVIVQGILFRWFQPRLGERKLLFYGLSLMAIGLMGVALSTKAWMLYPLIGAVVIGSGVSIPSLSGLTSNQFPAALQGKLMGGYQSILSLANILGPSLAGVSFEVIDTSAPYWLGFMLSITTLLIVRYALTQLPASTSEVRSAPG